MSRTQLQGKGERGGQEGRFTHAALRVRRERAAGRKNNEECTGSKQKERLKSRHITPFLKPVGKGGSQFIAQHTCMRLCVLETKYGAYRVYGSMWKEWGSVCHMETLRTKEKGKCVAR